VTSGATSVPVVTNTIEGINTNGAIANAHIAIFLTLNLDVLLFVFIFFIFSPLFF